MEWKADRGQADEVCHACVHDGKLLVCGLFDIEYTCNQAATLAHDGPPQFEMELLVRSQMQMLAVGLEIVCKMGNRHFVRMLVVDANPPPTLMFFTVCDDVPTGLAVR